MKKTEEKSRRNILNLQLAYRNRSVSRMSNAIPKEFSKKPDTVLVADISKQDSLMEWVDRNEEGSGL